MISSWSTIIRAPPLIISPWVSEYFKLSPLPVPVETGDWPCGGTSLKVSKVHRFQVKCAKNILILSQKTCENMSWETKLEIIQDRRKGDSRRKQRLGWYQKVCHAKVTLFWWQKSVIRCRHPTSHKVVKCQDEPEDFQDHDLLNNHTTNSLFGKYILLMWGKNGKDYLAPCILL